MGRGGLINRRRRGSASSDDGGGGGEADTSTIPDLPDVKLVKRSAFVRRVASILLAIFVLLGLLGLFGERDGTVTDTGGGYELSVRYAEVSRPGLDTPWVVTVKREAGFSGPLTIRTTASYFDLFDENGLDPEPDATLRDDQWITMEFAEPESKLIEIDFDARISPSQQSGDSAITQVMDGDTPVASVEYTTRLMP